ncbi:hypothetical protein BH10ACI1_BH10ACI1_02630 [soil metagenome]
MNKYIRSYPHTNDWKARTYKPEFQRINISLMVVMAILLSLVLNRAW